MINFKDRNVQHPSRQKLTIVSGPNMIAGDTLIVDTSREEGAIYEKGTPLTKEGLTDAFKPLSKIVDFLLSEYIIIHGSLEMNWIQSIGYKHSQVITLQFPKSEFHVSISFPSQLDCYIDDLSGPYRTITIEETTNLSSTPVQGTLTLNFYIDVYIDQAKTNLLTTLKGTLNYLPSSVQPID